LSEAGGDSSSGGGGKAPVHCKYAKECGGYNLFRQDFLLDDPDASWQGQIWGVCFKCSAFDDKKAFQKECKKRHEKRAVLVRGRRERARCITFKNVTEMIKLALPGASNSLVRELAVQRTKAVAAAFLASFEKMAPEAQQICHEINQEYLVNLDAAVKDPMNACSVDGHTLTAIEASYLTNVQEGIAFMFLCRMPDCLFFGMNSQWVEHMSRHWFKCPCCGEQYRPGADYKNSVEAKRVLQITDPVTGELTRIPTVWPPSEEMGWLNKQIELHARDIKTPEDVEAWHVKSTVKLHELLEKEKIPGGLAEMRPSSDIDHRFSSLWKWEEFKARQKFYGAKYPSEATARQPYSNWTELIGLVANIIASSAAILNKKN
jgi:hypothetical protein